MPSTITLGTIPDVLVKSGDGVTPPLIDYLQSNWTNIQATTINNLHTTIGLIVSAIDGYLTQKLQAINKQRFIHKQAPVTTVKLEMTDFVVILTHVLTIKHIHIDPTKNMDLGNHALYTYVPFPDDPLFGTYIPAHIYINKLMRGLDNNITLSKQKSIMAALDAYAPHEYISHDPNIIPVKNGLFYKDTKELKPFTPDIPFLSKINTNYIPSKQEPILKEPDGSDWKITEWIKELADADLEKEQLYWQILAASFQPGKSWDKAILLYSESGNNGKGTFGQLIKNILGANNYSTLKISDYGKKFRNVQLVGKILNIADENPVNGYLDDASDFKAAVTGDDISIEQKQEPVYSMSIHQLTIQMINAMPQLRDKTGSLARRLLIVPYNHSFTGTEKKYIKTKFMNDTDVKEFVLAKALEMDPFDEFLTPTVSKTMIAQFKQENNSVVEFWNEMIDECAWSFYPTNFIYDLYKAWMQRFNTKGGIVGKQQFVKYSIAWAEDTNLIEAYMSQPIRIKTMMAIDEPLITEYNLTNWMDSTPTNDPIKRRNFTRKDRYRGFKRL